MREWHETIKNLDKSLSVDNQCGSLREAFDKIQMVTQQKFSYSTSYDQPNSEFNTSISAVVKKPSKYQIALAINAAELCKSSNKRSLWELAAGSGKSRVISCLAAILLMMGRAKKVHLVYPNAALMKRDKHDYADYFNTQTPKLTEAVLYHSELNFQTTKDDIVIIDEADFFIFEKMQQF